MQTIRLSRTRKKAYVRDWVSQTGLSRKNIVFPLFVTEGRGVRRPIASMPGMYHLSIDKVIKELSMMPGLSSILLFGVTGNKDRIGSGAYKKTGVIQRAVRAIKKEFPRFIVISDVCLCAYTSHGHCGIVKGRRVDDDKTVRALARIAVSHAEAGADFVAPSAMMDGQVGAIRAALDKRKLTDAGIIAYSAKYASHFYGPFRDALNSVPRFGDRTTHQMDYRNSDEALREARQDILEGADIVMVKPALSYLDIIYRVRQEYGVPVAAYSVSGEYSMIKQACSGNREEEKRLALEVLTSIKRAGAHIIITYWAKEALSWLT